MQPSNPKEQHPDETLWFRLEGLIKGSGLDVLGFQGAPLTSKHLASRNASLSLLREACLGWKLFYRSRNTIEHPKHETLSRPKIVQ